MLHVLGFSEYGRNVFSEIKPPDSLRIEETRRGATISDEHGLLMETRAYWWGDTETEEDRKQAELRCKLVCFSLHGLVAKVSSKSHATLVAAWFASHRMPHCPVLRTGLSSASSTRV